MSHLRIHKYITGEIIIPVLLSLIIFTFVLLMGRIPRLTELIINKGVPAAEILELFSYLLPTFLTITVPLSFLLGILLAFGRLSSDSEFVALKASGVSLYALLKPVLLLAVLFSLATGWLTTYIEPAAKTSFRNELFRIASSRASVGIKPGVFNDDFDGIVLYTRSMDERRGIMQDVFISDERTGGTPATILAKQGRFIPDPDNFSLTLRLVQGSIHRKPVNENKSTYQLIGFKNYDIKLDLAAQLSATGGRHRSRGELSWSELGLATANASSSSSATRFIVEKHKRIAIAFAPLVFALVGVPLGLQSNRSGKGAGFSLALGVSIIYYLLLSIASTIAGKGLVPVAMALWLPNCCFLAGGSYFLQSTARERKMAIFSLPGRIANKLGQILSRQVR